jgi:hypothetical protein
MLVIELITSGASIIYVNTKCVWSILLWMEAPQQGRQGHTHQVSCYYFCSYIILKDNQKRLTRLVCGSPSNYHSVFSPAKPKLAVSSVLQSAVDVHTLKMTSSLRFHCAHSCARVIKKYWQTGCDIRKIPWLTINQPLLSFPLLTSV